MDGICIDRPLLSIAEVVGRIQLAYISTLPLGLNGLS